MGGCARRHPPVSNHGRPVGVALKQLPSSCHPCLPAWSNGGQPTYRSLWNRVPVSSDDGERRHLRSPRSAIATESRSPTPSAHATAPAVSLPAGWLTVLLPATSPFFATLAGAVCVHFLAPACLQRWQSFLLWGVVSFWSRLLPLPAPLGLPALLLKAVPIVNMT